MKISVVISAQSEWEGVKSVFPDVHVGHYLYGECFETTIRNFRLTFFHLGWWKTASAGALQYILDSEKPDLVINLGTCGGFAGVVNQEDVVLVERTFIYDIVELMDSADVTEYYASSLDLNWLAEPYPYPVRRGIVASADSDLVSEEGGEVYNQMDVFTERAKKIMQQLVGQLPDWLKGISL